MAIRNKKELLWEWVMYYDLCALHGSVPVPIAEPITYGLWTAINVIHGDRMMDREVDE